MAAWAGLGYYARARNLLACARAVAADHGGVFPDTEEGLRALPGVGAYTAAAVAAIAFDRPANVVDGNVERVMARLFAVEDPAAGRQARAEAPGRRRWSAAERPGDWAQALMDLGATVCRPKSPLVRPLPHLDLAARGSKTGAPETYPRKTKKADRPRRYGVAYVLTRGDAVALVRRPPKGLLGGMLGLPTSDWRSTPYSGCRGPRRRARRRRLARPGRGRARLHALLPDPAGAAGREQRRGRLCLDVARGPVGLPSVFLKAALANDRLL